MCYNEQLTIGFSLAVSGIKVCKNCGIVIMDYEQDPPTKCRDSKEHDFIEFPVRDYSNDITLNGDYFQDTREKMFLQVLDLVEENSNDPEVLEVIKKGRKYILKELLSV